MKNGQCQSCGSYQVRSNRNRKFPALNTIMLGSANSCARYASLDTYVCVTCGYVENYVASPADLNYISEEWETVEATDDTHPRSPTTSDALLSNPDEPLRTRILQGCEN